MDGFQFEYMVDGVTAMKLRFRLPLSEMSADDQIATMMKYISEWLTMLKTLNQPREGPHIGSNGQPVDMDDYIQKLMDMRGFEE